MKKQHITRAGIVILLLLAFGYTQAGFVPTISTTPACHGNDGSVTITGTGVPGPYYFYITGNGINEADSNIVSSATFSNLISGTYQLTAMAWGGTYASATFVISSVVNIQLTTTQPVCPTGTSGSAVATVTGGATPYNYQWSNGATTTSVNNLPVGYNSLLVTDQNGCMDTVSTNIQIVSPVQASITHSGPACAGNLNAVASGGTAPYSYVWSNNATTASITNLLSNRTYYLTITDANGCMQYAYASVLGTSLIFDSTATTVTNPSCGANGQITVVMASGAAPFTYLWSNGATGATINGLTQGIYYVTATDANGCTGASGYELYNNSLFVNQYLTNPDCGTATGAIEAYGGGGTPPYGYSWSNSTTNHTSFDTILTAGTYYYTITDAGGCTIIDTMTLIPQGSFTAQITVTPIVCPATAGGSMTVNVSGAGPYSYLWSNGATTQTISNLTEGSSFWVTATDNNGCQTQAVSPDSITITAPFGITLTSAACGTTVTAGVTGGGTSPYTYLWSNNATTATITYQLYNYYYVTVTDAHGCQATQIFYQNATGIQVDSTNSVVNPTCTSSGSITATPLNGVAPYTYLWSNGATTNPIVGLTAGYYQVTVTDANGCSGYGWYSLSNNSINIYASNSFTYCGATNGSITLYASSGTPPYSYIWSNSSTNHTDRDTLLNTGTYYCTVSDAGGCTYIDTDVLTGLGAYIATVSATPTACSSNIPTGTASVTITNGGNAPFSYSWQVWQNNTQSWLDTTTVQPGITGLAFGSIVWLQSVTDANGCVDSLINYTGTDTAGLSIGYPAGCYDTITGYVYTDLNGNCVMNQGEAGIEGIAIEVSGSNGENYYALTDANGFYSIQVVPGSYYVNSYNYSSCNNVSACVTNYTVSFTNSDVISSGNNFGYNSAPEFDLVVHTGYQPSVPGSTKEYWVYYYNQGSVSADNAVLTFIHDPNLTLLSTTPPYTSYDQATQTVIWDLGTVPVSYLSTNQQVIMQYSVPASLPLGTLLSAYDSIIPTVGDCNPANNIQYLTDPVTASHDPNVKQVSPEGNITLDDSVLSYTIRFMNNGNAAATQVVVIDTLSPLVNPASIVIEGSSSPCTWKLTGTGILTFTFSPINLPDSAQSVDSSQGFVMFSVHIYGSDAIGTQIKNTAYIYFDQNPAIVTNTTVSTLSLSTGFRNISASAMTITVSPNPVHDKSLFTIVGATGEVEFELDDIAGQKLFETKTTGRNIELESEPFAAGVYIYTARDTQGNTCTGKIVIAH